MEATDGFFQIRPCKEFNVARGRERILSLRILTEFAQHNNHNPAAIPDSHSNPASTSGSTPRTATTSRNAYDFMRSRRGGQGRDPAVQRWHAAIRLCNFTSEESSSCVSLLFLSSSFLSLHFLFYVSPSSPLTFLRVSLLLLLLLMVMGDGDANDDFCRLEQLERCWIISSERTRYLIRV